MGEYTPWPDFGPGKYLHEAMMALGPTRAQPMGGYRAADWPEIVAYSQACGPFERWELELLRDMCVAFVDGLRIGANPMGKPPIEF